MNNYHKNLDPKELLHEIELLRLAQEGSNEALAELFRRYEDYLRSVVRAKLNPQLRRLFDSDDLLQESFIKVFVRHVAKQFFFEQPQQLLCYVATIVENKVREAQRKYEAYQKHNLNRDISLEGDFLSQGIDPTESAVIDHSKPGDLEEWRAKVGELPQPDRDILLMRAEGYSHYQIADDLNLSEKTIRRIFSKYKADDADSPGGGKALTNMPLTMPG